MAEVVVKYTFEKVINRSLKQKVSKEIISSVQGSSEMRKEIRKVFQKANRRIQDLEKSGAFSPALASIGKGECKGYSKFSVKDFGNTGESWTELKKEYGKAVAFLNQPTSTVRGAKEFEKQVQAQLGVPEKLWSDIREAVLEGYNSTSADLLSALPYSTFMQEIYDRTTATAHGEIEASAIEMAETLQNEINKQAQEISGQVENILNGWEIGGL